jgi:hypothetical protein
MPVAPVSRHTFSDKGASAHGSRNRTARKASAVQGARQLHAIGASGVNGLALAERAFDGDLVESVLEDGELLLVELRDEQV